MRVHWLQHAEHEGLGCIHGWLRGKNFRVTHTRLHAGEKLPATRSFDWLIAMGGPMNVYEHGAHPWLRVERELINDACVANKRVLGICLGAQLLADVLGGKVSRNADSEIGWFDVVLMAEAKRSRLFDNFPDAFPAFHWHGDTFSLPPGTTPLMRSEACENQAFLLDGGRLLGLQFHLETTAADAALWLQQDPPPPGRYVQPAAEILREPARFRANHRLLKKLLDRLAK